MDSNVTAIAVDVNTACAKLSLSRSMVYKLLREKRLAGLKVGRKTLIPMGSINAFLASLPGFKRAG